MPSPANGAGACVFQPAGLYTASRCSSSKFTHGTMQHENSFQGGNKLRSAAKARSCFPRRPHRQFPGMENQTVIVSDISNREFLERYAQPGRVGLCGGLTSVDTAIRR